MVTDILKIPTDLLYIQHLKSFAHKKLFKKIFDQHCALLEVKSSPYRPGLYKVCHGYIEIGTGTYFYRFHFFAQPGPNNK
jgi:hypothetical protein